MDQLVIRLVYQHLPLQDLPKFTQIGIFGFENMPSGNPVELLLIQFLLLFFLGASAFASPKNSLTATLHEQSQ
jgi:hypothetical protein